MKKKIKILLVVISICVVFFALAISSSASSYVDDSNFSYSGSVYVTSYSNTDNNFDSKSPENFGAVYLTDNDGSAFGFLNIEFWEQLMTEYNVQDSSGFASLRDKLIELGYIEDSSNWSSFWNYSESYYNAYLSYKNQITNDDLDERYEAGKVDGVSEYKESSQYTLDIMEEVKKITGGNSEGLEAFYDDPSSMLGAPSMREAVIPYGEDKSLYMMTLTGSRIALVVDSSILRDFCSLNSLTNRSEFYDFVTETYVEESSEGEYVYSGLTGDERSNIYYFLMDLNSGFDELFLEALNYSEITSENLDERYETGKTEGVTEYKESEEYTTVINNSYSNGYSIGVSEYKESTEFTTLLKAKYNDGFVAGTAEGALSYVKSEAYKTALSDEYDKGYDDGFTEGESQINVAPLIGGVLIICAFSLPSVILHVVNMRKFKKK